MAPAKVKVVCGQSDTNNTQVLKQHKEFIGIVVFRFIIDRFLSRIGHGSLRILAKIQLRDICLFAGGWIKAKSKKMTFVVYFKTVTHL